MNDLLLALFENTFWSHLHPSQFNLTLCRIWRRKNCDDENCLELFRHVIQVSQRKQQHRRVIR